MRSPLSTGPPILAAVVVAILALAGPADAQVLYGSIVGNITDSSQGAIPGATVTAINTATNLARETTTTGDGGYAFANLQEGTYTVRISLQGFKEFVEEGVPVSPNTVSRVDIILEVGALTETVTVQSERTLLQTDAGDLHTTIDGDVVEKVSLGAYRNYQSILNLTPGVTPGQFQNAVMDTPGRALSNNVNGTARNNNNTRLDGATNVFVWLPHHAMYVAPAETIDTVNVSTASFDAEQGMAGGAAISVLTKSGTNEFHGSGTYLFENDSLRARNFFNTGDKPETDRKIYAFTLGGPVVKDRLFFFASFEGQSASEGFTRTGTLPTEDQRRGDFSAYDTIIYDPATGNPDGTGRTPFPGNIIPADRINPTSAALQDRLPLPNQPGTSGNYNATGNSEFSRQNYDIKLNWNVTNSAMVWGKYSRMDGEVNSDQWLGNIDAGGAGGSGWDAGYGKGDTKVQIGSLGLTWTVSPTLVVDAVAGMMRFDQEVIGSDAGQAYGLDVLGIPGTNGAGCCEADARYNGMPRFDIEGYDAFGGVDGWSPIFRDEGTENFSLNATWIKGAHDMRFGADIVHLWMDHWQPELGHPRGRFWHDGDVTALAPAGSPDQFNAYAQFLLGTQNQVQKSIQYELQTTREWQYGLYFRDRWQVNRNLTLTLGLRWEKYPMAKREGRGMEAYDAATNTVTLCGRGGTPDDCGFNVEHASFLPRVGFAYRLGEDNVIRGGYGRTVSPSPLSRPLRGFYPLTIANTFPADSFQAISTFQQGIPLIIEPPRDAATLPLPDEADMRSVIDTLHRGHVDSWNLTFERRLPYDMSLSAGYVGTKTTNQMGFYNFNASFAGGGEAGKPLNQLFGRTGGTYRFDGWLNANYHSLQVALNKPFSRGLLVKAAYTWSKAMNRTDDEGWSTVNWNDPAAQFKNYAWAGFDRTHMFTLGVVWDMPFGRDGEGALNALIKDWSVNGFFGVLSGTPFRVSSPDASCNCPGNSQSADRISDPVKLGGIGSGNPYYDRSSWAPVTEVRYGNEGRNHIRGPGAWRVNMSLFRRIPIGAKVMLELRAEGFNLFNHPTFGNPEGDVSSSGFMDITSTGAPERQFRLGARLSF